MEIVPAERVSKIKPYFFANLEKIIEKLKLKGMDIIRLDMGSPDLPPAPHIIETLVEAARRPDMHGYGEAGGSFPLRLAIAKYYQSRFGVELNPESEVLSLIGSKEGIFNLTQVLINPGDLILLPDPCYPVYSVGPTITQSKTFHMPLLAENGFLPNLDDIPERVLQEAKLMWLNYPNNPTGAIASLSFFEKVVEYAKKYQILIAHDAPYLDVCFDAYQAPSLLEIPGAKEVAIEFNSISKTYNMAGWRVGMALGNPEVIRLLRILKSQMDSSHFKPIMKAAEAALLSDQDWVKERNLVYQDRRDIVVSALQKLGFSVENPKASLYIWAKIPDQWPDAFIFCETLLHKTGVSMTPGAVYGPSGKCYVRISLVTPAERLEEAMDRIKKTL
jgi:LL-diaminopimelate aminotransferase